MNLIKGLYETDPKTPVYLSFGVKNILFRLQISYLKIVRYIRLFFKIVFFINYTKFFILYITFWIL